MGTQFYSLEIVAQNDGRNGNKIWVVIRDSVYDLTTGADQHPGGIEPILEWAGKDATKAFDDAGHSSDARKQLTQYKIGELREEDRKKNKNKSAETSQNQDRSIINYITCGLCG